MTRTGLTSQFRSSSTNSNSAPPATVATIIQRHGPSDGVVNLNVGGKNFQTLRSTIAQNEVLMDHVVRAEANAEIISGGHAVFIDRDPKHFGTILAYLRNKADGMDRHPSIARRLMKFGDRRGASAGDNCKPVANAKEVTSKIVKSMPSASSLVHLPKDSKTLTEMYFESLHYDIPELSNHICAQQSLTRLFGVFGSKNPFQMASTALVAGKRMLVLFGGLLTGMGGWAYAEATAARAKTLEFLSSTKDFYRDGSFDVDESEFWMNQSEVWKKISEKWNEKTRGEEE